MAKMIYFIFIAASISWNAFANLEFRANIPSVELSEEAILLMECIAERTHSSWELVEKFHGPHWISFEQVADAVQVNYANGDSVKSGLLNFGATKAVCDNLEPELALKISSSEVNPILTGKHPSSDSFLQKNWIILGTGSVVILAGLFWLFQKSGSVPKYSSVQME